MGLDQYVYSVDAKLAKDDLIDINLGSLIEKRQTHMVYGARNFYGLHYFMKRLYISRGGIKANDQRIWGCVRVNPGDIDALEKSAKVGSLVGDRESDRGLNENRLAFELVNIAREEFDKGNALYYSGY